MRRYIVLLLITGILWAQTDFDTLILKDGTTYFGEYSKIEEKIVYFKPQGVGAFQRVHVKQIQTLKLKDGLFIIGDGRNRLTLEEYQKLSTKEKAIYDAKSKNLVKWALYGSISPIIISVYDFFTGVGGAPRKSLAFSTAIGTIPYFVLNRKEKFNFPKSILTDSEKEIYEQAYSKELQKRKFIHFLGCTIVTGGFLRFIGKYNTSDRSGYDLSGHGTAW